MCVCRGGGFKSTRGGGVGYLERCRVSPGVPSLRFGGCRRIKQRPVGALGGASGSGASRRSPPRDGPLCGGYGGEGGGSYLCIKRLILIDGYLHLFVCSGFNDDCAAGSGGVCDRSLDQSASDGPLRMRVSPSGKPLT